MRNARRLIMLGLLLCGLLVLAPDSWAQQRAPILEQIAKTYGIDSWDQIQAIRYTWNGEITGLFKAAHMWVWEPKTGKVSYEGKDKDGKPVKVTFVQSELNGESPVVKDRIDCFFVIDKLLDVPPFPCLLGLARRRCTGQGHAEIAVGEGFRAANCDAIFEGRLHAWRYLGPIPRPDNRIEEMVYHRGDPKSTVPGLIKVTWASYKKAGPLLFS